jgi:tripartite-type tricarboxylate transporter receptor subunit TctC
MLRQQFLLLCVISLGTFSSLKALMKLISKLALATSLAAGAALTAPAAIASDFPGDKPITFVVPFAAGGPTDLVARTLAQAMTKPLGAKAIVVENTAGAGGTIGTTRVANAPGDGYTLLLMHVGFTTAPSLYRKVNYDPVAGFEPIGLVVDVPLVLIARDNFPANNFQEFLTYAKANKDKLSFANAGTGAVSQLCGLMFMSAIKTEFQTVPYKGTAPAMTDLLGKQVDFMCDQTTNTTANIKAGKVKAFAITSAKRSNVLPNIPTMDEVGLKGFQLGSWHGLWAPKGTPKPVVDKLVAALNQALKDPAFAGKMAELGAEVMPAERATPKGLGDHVKTELAKWGPVIKAAGVYAD